VDVLSSRVLLWPTDLDRNPRFYRDLLGWPSTGSSAPRRSRGGVLPRPGLARGLWAHSRPSRALGDDLDPGTRCPRRARPPGAAGVPSSGARDGVV